ncbi:MAG: PQQ-dependent sugar dehydrogenase [Pseudomonadota bacterium]
MDVNRGAAGGRKIVLQKNASKSRRSMISRARAAARGISGRARIALLALFIAGIASVSFIAGFESALRQFFPYSILQKIDHRISQYFKEPDLTERVIETGLIELKIKPVKLDFERGSDHEKGGGLASFGEDLLVLTYDRRLIFIGEDGAPRVSQITLPENNREAYKRAYRAILDGEGGAVIASRGLHYLRNQDLEFIETAVFRGLVVSFLQFHPDQNCTTLSLAQLPLAESVMRIDEIEAGPADWNIFFRTSPCLPFKSKNLALAGHMAAGRIALKDERALYLAVGDLGFDGVRADGPAFAQDPANDYGKLLAVDLVTGDAERISIGHRNMQGLALGADGVVFGAEHGPRGGDELNIIQPGGNYGWPLESLGTLYSMTAPPQSQVIGRHDNFAAPAHAWIPSPAISSLMVADEFHPAWDGDVIAGSLRQGGMFRVRLNGDRAVYSEYISLDVRVRDLHQHTDGRIAVLTDDYVVLFLTPDALTTPAERTADFASTASLSETRKARLVEAVAACAQCHAFTPGDDVAAPNLAYIYGDKIAAGAYGGYSAALKGQSGRWSEDNLAAFLANPQSFAPGVLMPAPEIADQQAIDDLVAYLAYLDQQR